MSVRSCFAIVFLAVLFTTDATLAQVANSELEACRATGLIALRERNPAIKDVSLDMDSMTVAKANTKVEDTPIRTIIVGDAYLEQGRRLPPNVSVLDWREGQSVAYLLYRQIIVVNDARQASSLTCFAG